ncbi:hypothetical protein C0993_005699, partial [Termitomyces sp. T159_Od127]
LNRTTFKVIMTKAACGQGLLKYFTGTNKNLALTPSDINNDEKEVLGSLTTAHPTSTTWWGTANPMVEEWLQCDAYTRSMITLNVVNPMVQ